MDQSIDPPSGLTDEFLDTLCDKFQPLPETRAQFRRGILNAGRIWEAHRNAPTAPTDQKENRRTLKKIGNAALNLHRQLKDAPEDVWDIMNDSKTWYVQDEFYGYFDTEDRTAHGLPSEPNDSRRFILPDPAQPATEISARELSAVLITLANASSCALREAIPPKQGPQQDVALKAWVRDMAALWKITLQRPFTRDVGPTGEPISQAAEFCVDVYAKMDPSTPPSRVINEMKKLISERNR